MSSIRSPETKQSKFTVLTYHAGFFNLPTSLQRQLCQISDGFHVQIISMYFYFCKNCFEKAHKLSLLYGDHFGASRSFSLNKLLIVFDFCTRTLPRLKILEIQILFVIFCKIFELTRTFYFFKSPTNFFHPSVLSFCQ